MSAFFYRPFYRFRLAVDAEELQVTFQKMILEKLKCVSNKRYEDLRKLEKLKILVRGPSSFIKLHGFHKKKANKCFFLS